MVHITLTLTIDSHNISEIAETRCEFKFEVYCPKINQGPMIIRQILAILQKYNFYFITIINYIYYYGLQYEYNQFQYLRY